MPGAKIPTTIETAIETTCIAWPSGDEWYALLIGAISDLARASYWDPNSGDPEVAAEWALTAVYATLDVQEDCMIPTGTIVAFGGTTAPAGWVIGDGSYYVSTDPVYASLFAVIGSFGPMIGDNAKLPDLRGRVPVGQDVSQPDFEIKGWSGGAATHTLTTAEMPAHLHPLLIDTGTVAAYTSGPGRLTSTTNRLGRINPGSANIDLSASIGQNGSGQAHNNLPPYLVVNYIIKL